MQADGHAGRLAGRLVGWLGGIPGRGVEDGRRYPPPQGARRLGPLGAEQIIMHSAVQCSTARCSTACAARLASALGSARHLRKVVCSCGTKGLSPAPARASRMPSVLRMAALVCHGKRSPTMRIRGPVIWRKGGGKGDGWKNACRGGVAGGGGRALGRREGLLRYTGGTGARQRQRQRQVWSRQPAGGWREQRGRLRAGSWRVAGAARLSVM